MRPRAFKDLARLPDPTFFVEIARGLNLCAHSALMLFRDARLLGGRGRNRGYEILVGFAREEAAKFHMLLDGARCPRNIEERSRQLGYCADHLAKQIYAEYYEWTGHPTFSEVRNLAEQMRQEYYIDGPNGWDWIFRNDKLTIREQHLYVDYVDEGEGDHKRWDPLRPSTLFPAWIRVPPVLEVALALRRAGFASSKAIEVVASIWRDVTIHDGLSWDDERKLNEQTLRQMDSLGLLRRASEQTYMTIIDEWRFPLYSLNLRIAKGELGKMKEAREKMFLHDIVGNIDY